ncbi:hypothetical protein IG631_15067 [Alternaria alternata]|nr:hypothetical protein IG631_15067 [Alternaria alternata]
MAFSFGFSGDDIEEDPNDVQDQGQQPATTDSDVPPPIPAKTHDLDELNVVDITEYRTDIPQLSTLPDKLSYSTVSIASPKGFTARLPRRELFDVRLQLMAEDDGSSQTPLTGLDVRFTFPPKFPSQTHPS